jgi:hypothetical protein
MTSADSASSSSGASGGASAPRADEGAGLSSPAPLPQLSPIRERSTADGRGVAARRPAELPALNVLKPSSGAGSRAEGGGAAAGATGGLPRPRSDTQRASHFRSTRKKSREAKDPAEREARRAARRAARRENREKEDPAEREARRSRRRGERRGERRSREGNGRRERRRAKVTNRRPSTSSSPRSSPKRSEPRSVGFDLPAEVQARRNLYYGTPIDSGLGATLPAAVATGGRVNSMLRPHTSHATCRGANRRARCVPRCVSLGAASRARARSLVCNMRVRYPPPLTLTLTHPPTRRSQVCARTPPRRHEPAAPPVPQAGAVVRSYEGFRWLRLRSRLRGRRRRRAARRDMGRRRRLLHDELWLRRRGRRRATRERRRRWSRAAKRVRRQQVSFLLCTVTFHANLAHSSTRSPEHLWRNGGSAASSAGSTVLPGRGLGSARTPRSEGSGDTPRSEDDGASGAGRRHPLFGSSLDRARPSTAGFESISINVQPDFVFGGEPLENTSLSSAGLGPGSAKNHFPAVGASGDDDDNDDEEGEGENGSAMTPKSSASDRSDSSVLRPRSELRSASRGDGAAGAAEGSEVPPRRCVVAHLRCALLFRLVPDSVRGAPSPAPESRAGGLSLTFPTCAPLFLVVRRPATRIASRHNAVEPLLASAQRTRLSNDGLPNAATQSTLQTLCEGAESPARVKSPAEELLAASPRRAGQLRPLQDGVVADGAFTSSS